MTNRTATLAAIAKQHFNDQPFTKAEFEEYRKNNEMVAFETLRKNGLVKHDHVQVEEEVYTPEQFAEFTNGFSDCGEVYGDCFHFVWDVQRGVFRNTDVVEIHFYKMV